MEHISLSGPVGVLPAHKHGNRQNDVYTVQFLLKFKGFDPDPLNGVCGEKTIDAIIKFQSTFMAKPDGRIDPHGSALKKLTPPDPVEKPFDLVIPFLPAPIHIPAITFKQKLPLPEPGAANAGLRFASNKIMTKQFGLPRSTFTQDCQPPTNPKIAKNLKRTHVGRTPVTGLKPAVELLDKITAEIAKDFPLLHAHIGSAGMLCCRHVRGSDTHISNHSWGTAIDITIDGAAESRGERDAWLGYTMMAPYFNKYGWNWGAAFPTPDPHHFECGADLIEGFVL
jgi:hypothetical protein